MKKKELVKIVKTDEGKFKMEFDPLFAVKSRRGEAISPTKVFRSKKAYRRHPKHKKRFFDYEL